MSGIRITNTYISSGMSLHHSLPMVGRIQGGILWFTSNGSWVEQNIGSLQCHCTCCLWKPLIPTNGNPNHANLGVKNSETRVSRSEIELFLVSYKEKNEPLFERLQLERRNIIY